MVLDGRCEMRVATWNLARCKPGSASARQLTNWMLRINADVWVLTESNIALSPGPAFRLVSCSAEADDLNRRGERWVCIWTRLPASPVALLGDVERHTACVIGNTPIIGTVLPWNNDERDIPLKGAAAFLRRLEEQAIDWKMLRSTHGSLCLCGDFNQDLLESGHYYGSRVGRDTLRRHFDEIGLSCTTCGSADPLNRAGQGALIDHICTAGLELTGRGPSVWPRAGTLDQVPTDHHGVYIDVGAV